MRKRTVAAYEVDGQYGADGAAVPAWSALVLGSIGVLGFSFTLPATRLALTGLSASVVGLGRAVVAAILAGAVLVARRERLPPSRHLGRLVVVALGVVVGFPLFSALALRDTPAAHGAVVVGLLPAATAVWAVVRAGERPSKKFWLACLVGVASVILFALSQGAGSLRSADAFLLLAVMAGSLGYAEGGALAREIGGWRVICWALVISMPLLVPVVAGAVLDQVQSGGAVPARAWLGFGYVAGVSMFAAFFAWYAGLARGGVARISQLQLAQPVLTLLWSALLLDEVVDGKTLVAAVLVLMSVAWTQSARRPGQQESQRSRRANATRAKAPTTTK